MVYKPVATLEVCAPALTAMAFIVVVVETLIGALYCALAAVGVEASVV
jgi:hypothetical protein